VGIDNSDGDKFKISEAGALHTNTLFTIQQGGNVGIGTTSPGAKLEVAGTVTINNRFTVNATQIYTNANNENYNTLKSDYRAGGNGYSITGTLIDSRFSTNSANILNTYGLRITNAVSGNYTGTNAYGLYVEQPTGATNNYGAYINGNVGIGTTSPNEALTLGADGVLSIDERATAPSNTAAHGKLWVKNTVPTELWFTDDAGTSTKII